MSEPLPKIWLISWMYSDRSESGFIRAFDNEDMAKDLLKLLQQHGGDGKHYSIDGIECCREYD